MTKRIILITGCSTGIGLEASKTLSKRGHQVIATCRALGNEAYAAAETVDLSTLSVHQTKRLEMEIQVKVLSLETQLEKQREQLFELRKMQYVTATSTEENDKNE